MQLSAKALLWPFASMLSAEPEDANTSEGNDEGGDEDKDDEDDDGEEDTGDKCDDDEEDDKDDGDLLNELDTEEHEALLCSTAAVRTTLDKVCELILLFGLTFQYDHQGSKIILHYHPLYHHCPSSLVQHVRLQPVPYLPHPPRCQDTVELHL
jgi:hypothetical protein